MLSWNAYGMFTRLLDYVVFFFFFFYFEISFDFDVRQMSLSLSLSPDEALRTIYQQLWLFKF